MIQRALLRRSLPPPGERRRLREGLGLTQAEVAAVIGTTRAAVSRYESGGRQPRGAVAERYAHLLERIAEEVDVP